LPIKSEAELVVTVDQNNRPAEPRGNVQGEGGLSGSRGTGKMDCVSNIQVAQRPARQRLNIRSQDEFLAGLGYNVLPFRFDNFTGY
jgi:hypothetical protein